VPLEVRHPYVDIRVLRCMLRMPALPWCRSKYLMRRALRGTVPERARTRAKAPLAGDPLRERISRIGPPESRPSLLSRKYGNETRLKWTETAGSAYGSLQFVALTHWLDRNASSQFTQTAKEDDEDGLKDAASA
jgi:hypothetical protein